MMKKDLPPGWSKRVYCRKGGKQAGKWNVHFFTPCGIKIGTKKKLKDLEFTQPQQVEINSSKKSIEQLL